MSGLLERIESFYRRMDLLKIGFCLRVVDRVVVDAVEKVDGDLKLCHLLAQICGYHIIPEGADAGLEFPAPRIDLFTGCVITALQRREEESTESKWIVWSSGQVDFAQWEWDEPMFFARVRTANPKTSSSTKRKSCQDNRLLAIVFVVIQ